MTDQRLDMRTDALIRRLDVDSSADPSFVDSTFAALAPRVRSARGHDRSPIGRVQRLLELALPKAPPSSVPRPLLILGVVLLLILALIASLVIGGAIKRLGPIDNGPLIVSLNGRLEAIDPAGSTVRAIGPPGERAEGVSRSPDGRLAAYWTKGPGASQLHLIGMDGHGGRVIAVGEPVQWVAHGIDTWSPDSKALASEVMLGDDSRILVTNVQTGVSALIGPSGVSAHAPLWSPNGQWIAFNRDSLPHPTLAVMRPDGSGARVISGDVGGITPVGANNWSPDGTWVYYGGTIGGAGRLLRAAFALGGGSQRLSGDDVSAFAPALSPDGTKLSFIVPDAGGGWDLYAAMSDGAAPHEVLSHATNLGWSSDNLDVLAEWTPTDRLGGIALVKPDGTGLRVIYPFDRTCQASVDTCVVGIGWGQPRP